MLKYLYIILHNIEKCSKYILEEKTDEKQD